MATHRRPLAAQSEKTVAACTYPMKIGTDLCRVCLIVAATDFPARIAAVASPDRSECPAYDSGLRPIAMHADFTTWATASPDILAPL